MKEEISKKQGIYIDLDSLFDTRLSTLYGIDPNAVANALTTNYFSRRTDIFEGVDKGVFDEAYKVRNRVTLSNAVVTKSVGFIKELVLRLSSQAIKTPFHTGPKVFINVYPYVLDDSEIDAIIEGFVYVTEGKVDVQAIDIDFNGLTPQFCKDNLAYMFVYDYPHWLEAQANNFKELPCSEIMAIVPGIYFKEEPTKVELAEAIQNFMHPLRAMEFVSAYFIDLKLYDIDLFCANIQVQESKEKE